MSPFPHRAARSRCVAGPARVVAALVLLLALAPSAGAYTVTTLTGFNQPHAVAISPDGATAYVPNYGGSESWTIGVVDLATRSARPTAIDTNGGRPTDVAFAPAGDLAYVTSDVWKLQEVDATRESLTGVNLPTDAADSDTNPHAVVITADGTRAYTANFGTGGIGVVDLASRTAREVEVEAGVQPSDLAVHESGTVVVAVDVNSNKAWVVQTALPTAVHLISGTFNAPISVALSPDGQIAYIANLGNSTISVVDVAQRSVSSTFSGLSSIVGITTDATGDRLYAALSRRIAIIDAATGDIVDEIPMDADLSAIAVSPDGTQLVTANSNSNSVSIVRLAPAAPSALSASASDTAATVSFTAPAANGTPITGYEYSLDGGPWTAASPAATASPLVIGGLTPGTRYAIRVRAIDARGAGAASDAVSVTTQTPAASGPTPPPDTPRTTVFRARTPSATRTKAGRTRLRTTVTTPSAGTITQRATTSGPGRAKAVTRCQTRLRVRAAGNHVVFCTLNAKAQAALKRGRLVVRVATTFTAEGAKRGETTTARVVVPRRR